ncbi:hypothetical protein OG982_06075 [Streptomyces sp. NBC_01551]|uniref:hypothetical protein n=1 Tax=Streptomyces sp. NBC_01551 TaxID=2975876 RepID=UPI002258DD84|nr:hypothetical protein [Streptomyces sp. NBC_01551]MCX4525260.1 hypothetical protein [Streptomyces sp. NBC_01551]
MSTKTQTAQQARQSASTADLLADLLATARPEQGGVNAGALTDTAVVLQQRCGRRSSVGTRNTADPAQLLAEEVDAHGGFLTLGADVVRRRVGETMRQDAAAAQRDPEAGHQVRTHLQVLEDVGLAVFPGPSIPSGALRVLVYEPGTVVGQVLAALTVGDDVTDQVAAVAEAAR